MLNTGSDASEHTMLIQILSKLKNCCWSLRKWRAGKKRRMLIQQLEGIGD